MKFDEWIAEDFAHTSIVDDEYLRDIAKQAWNAARTMTPVSERLPDNYDTCIVTDGKHYAESVYRNGIFELSIESDEYFDEITHWMPEPEIPG